MPTITLTFPSQVVLHKFKVREGTTLATLKAAAVGQCKVGSGETQIADLTTVQQAFQSDESTLKTAWRSTFGNNSTLTEANNHVPKSFVGVPESRVLSAEIKRGRRSTGDVADADQGKGDGGGGGGGGGAAASGRGGGGGGEPTAGRWANATPRSVSAMNVMVASTPGTRAVMQSAIDAAARPGPALGALSWKTRARALIHYLESGEGGQKMLQQCALTEFYPRIAASARLAVDVAAASETHCLLCNGAFDHGGCGHSACEDSFFGHNVLCSKCKDAEEARDSDSCFICSELLALEAEERDAAASAGE